MYIDSNDTLYICDHSDESIKVWFKGAINGTRVPDGHGNHTDYMAFDKNGYFYITDYVCNNVRRYSTHPLNYSIADGYKYFSFWMPFFSDFSYPLGIDIDENLNIYVTNKNNQRVIKWASNGTKGTIVINTNLSNISFTLSTLRLSKKSSNQVYLSDQNNSRVYLWSFNSSYPDIILNEVRNSAALRVPKDLIFDPYENLYVAENSASGRIIRYCPNSTIGEVVIEGNNDLTTAKVGIAFDSQLNLYALLRNGTVLKYALL